MCTATFNDFAMCRFESEFDLHVRHKVQLADRNRFGPAFVSSSDFPAQRFTYPLNDSGSDDARPIACCNARASQPWDDGLRALLKADQERGPDFFVWRTRCTTLMVLNVAQCNVADEVSGAMSEVDSFPPSNIVNRSRKAVSHSL